MLCVPLMGNRARLPMPTLLTADYLCFSKQWLTLTVKSILHGR
jgi:hypothetical protein